MSGAPPRDTNVQCKGKGLERLNALVIGVPLDDPRVREPTTLDMCTSGKQKRNTFACTNCHAQKAKCVPLDPRDIYGKACVRCAKRNKLCTFDLSRRTRRRKHEGEFVKSSGSSKSTPAPHGLVSSPHGSHSHEATSQIWMNTTEVNRNGLTTDSSSSWLYFELQGLLSSQREKLDILLTQLTTLNNKWSEIIKSSDVMSRKGDLIEQGIITYHEAQFRLDLYRSEISKRHRLPFVKIPENQTLDDLKTHEPILFATIMCVVSAMLNEDQSTVEKNIRIDDYALALVSNALLRVGETSLEMLRCLLVMCFWYNLPESSNKSRFHLFNYICCSLVRELLPSVRPRFLPTLNASDRSDREQEMYRQFFSKNQEYARLVLLAYMSAININIYLKQSIQNKWGPMQEIAYNALIEAASTHYLVHVHAADEILITFAKLNHVLEIIHIKLHEAEEDENENRIFVISPKKEQIIHRLEADLKDVFKGIPSERHRALAFYYSVDAYLHDWIFTSLMPKSVDKINREESSPKLIAAFRRFWESCMSALYEFMQLTPDLISSLPLFHISRIIYTVGMLLVRLRYITITVPAFSALKHSTSKSLSLVQQVSELLDRSAQLYPFNNFLTKMRYVVALFIQMYANKLMSFVDKNQQANLKETNKIVNTQVPDVQFQNSVNVLLNPSPPPKSVAMNNPLQPQEQELDDLAGYLADWDSLELGFNTLNDEFWADVFLSNA
ncbi:LAMI_0G09362g1_1 [Lachancea mirantina]|uniref:LAMI_0G09362g1_1 n=1 Tax=Lachancea mirantina TaxID=1230905 RepID=A0A1G4KA81_9SACH|nr:LAMI_0G09362g1_1 [Lachancea mirantina]